MPGMLVPEYVCVCQCVCMCMCMCMCVFVCVCVCVSEPQKQKDMWRRENAPNAAHNGVQSPWACPNNHTRILAVFGLHTHTPWSTGLITFSPWFRCATD